MRDTRTVRCAIASRAILPQRGEGIAFCSLFFDIATKWQLGDRRWELAGHAGRGSECLESSHSAPPGGTNLVLGNGVARISDLGFRADRGTASTLHR